MYSRLIKFIEKQNILYDKQFWFRSNHSTEHAILSIVKIQEAIEEGNFSCRIFLDFRKAFDTVNHEILIEKLEYYGIRGGPKKWFISYLFTEDNLLSLLMKIQRKRLFPAVYCRDPFLDPFYF